MKKSDDILIIIFAIIVVVSIFGTLHLLVNESKMYEGDYEQIEYKAQSKFEIERKNNLNTFLEKPIDLQEFKKRKNRDVTTSVNNGMKYYFQPNISDSIFYGYNFRTGNIGTNRINEIVVFKYGENKHLYEDDTEILIELRIFNKDSDLGKANLIGLSKTELEFEFGSDYLSIDNQIVYSNKNKVLLIELNSSKVFSYKYLKLNTEKINSNLIQHIAE